MSLICILTALCAGCGESPPKQQGEEFSPIQLVANEVFQDGVPEPRLAGLIPASDIFAAHDANRPVAPEQPLELPTLPAEEQTWAFPSDNPNRELLKLPAVDVTPTADSPGDSSTATTDEPEAFQPLASLLPPLPLEMAPDELWESKDINNVTSVDDVAAKEGEVEPVTPLEIDPATAEKKLVDAVVRDSPAATTGVLTNQRVNELAKEKIRSAYAMANRGGYYAARQELIEVLRMISQGKDAEQGIRERTESLAQGLRALEEAEDFAPRGIQLEADLAIDVLCASHRTPIAAQLAKQIDSQKVLPHQMMNSYYRYAQLKLAAAVAGEPAGSMALHALGKLATQLGHVEPEKHRLSQRRAIAFQRAALLAHRENHLAAHELATLLADAGHFVEAEKLLRQVAIRDPNAVVLRNLSIVQEKLGLMQQATVSTNLAHQMLQRGASGTNNVQWISPQDFSRTGGTVPPAATATAQPMRMPPRNMPPQRAPVAQPVWR